MAEFTLKSILLGSLFGILFGSSTVYLALKAGLTVTASIPIAVIAITLGRKFLKTTILENNIIQTTGSAGESIAAGVVFTLPGFLFLSPGANGVSIGEAYFDYLTILILGCLWRYAGNVDDDTAEKVADREGTRRASISGGNSLRICIAGGRKGWSICANRLCRYGCGDGLCGSPKGISCHC